MPGGRPKGSEGANRREIRAMLRDRYPDWHPVVQMAETAQDPEASEELRFQAAKEVAGYLAPKLKAIEVTGEDGGALQIITGVATDAKL